MSAPWIGRAGRGSHRWELSCGRYALGWGMGHVGIDAHVIEWSGEHGHRDRSGGGTVLCGMGEYPRWKAATAPTISHTSTSSPTIRMMCLLGYSAGQGLPGASCERGRRVTRASECTSSISRRRTAAGVAVVIRRCGHSCAVESGQPVGYVRPVSSNGGGRRQRVPSYPRPSVSGLRQWVER